MEVCLIAVPFDAALWPRQQGNEVAAGGLAGEGCEPGDGLGPITEDALGECTAGHLLTVPVIVGWIAMVLVRCQCYGDEHSVVHAGQWHH